MTRLFNEVLGQEVEVPDAPRRIVSFSPAATETLFEVGAEESVVGVSAFCARPPGVRAKRKVGSYNTVREEVLRELKPDLIVTVTGYQREFAVGLSKKFPVYPLELPVTVAGIVDFVTKVGLICGKEDRGRELAGELLRSVSRLGRGRRRLVYVELDLGGPVTFGAHSYITDAIGLLGSESLFGHVKREWLTPDLGAVVRADPDVIFYEPKMYSGAGEDGFRSLVRERGWEELRAVKTGCSYVTPGPLDFLAHHGPSFITQALPWIGEKLDAGAGT